MSNIVDVARWDFACALSMLRRPCTHAPAFGPAWAVRDVCPSGVEGCRLFMRRGPQEKNGEAAHRKKEKRRDEKKEKNDDDTTTTTTHNHHQPRRCGGPPRPAGCSPWI